MYSDRSYDDRRDPAEIKRAGIASIAIVIAALALFIFGPRHDPTKVVVGMPCSVLSEAEIGATLGTPMQLMPSDGSICRYVPADPRHTQTLYIIAQRGIAPAVTVLSNAASASSPQVTVRTGARRYTVVIVPAAPDSRTAYATEMRVARLVQRPVIAANR